MKREILPVKTLANTKAAIEAYDTLNAEFDGLIASGASQQSVLDFFGRIEEAGKAVGVAFSVDTADRNSPAMCKNIRPTEQLRQAVRDWEQRQN